MEKAYNPTVKRGQVQWYDGEEGNTPVCAYNLNNIHNGLITIDQRVIDLDTDTTKMKGGVHSITYNDTTGIIKAFDEDGNTLITIDLNIEQIPIQFSMDSNGVITMVCADGTRYTADIGALIKTYTFVDSSTIDFEMEVDTSGNKSVTASIKSGSITFDMLDSSFRDEMNAFAAQITQAVTTSSEYARLSKSYAMGDTDGARENEDTDNAKYYKEQAEHFAQYAKDASVIGEFTVDSDGYLIYEDNTVHRFIVDDNGDLWYEVIGTL